MKKLKASFTAEAAIVMPLFVIAVTVFTILIKMIGKQSFTNTLTLECETQLTKECSEIFRDAAGRDLFWGCVDISDPKAATEAKGMSTVCI